MTLITNNSRTEIVKEPFATYQAFQALNHSSLKLSDIHGTGCPLKAWTELTAKWKTAPEPESDEDADDDTATDAMLFGTLYHSFLLEPGEFRKQAAILDAVMMARLYDEALATGSKAKGFSKQLATYKNWRDGIERAGMTVVDERTAAKMEDMRVMLWLNDEIRDELTECNKTEVSVYFGLPVRAGDKDGPKVQCKARIDALAPGVVLDLKTCRSAHPLEFARQIPRLGYDTQAAWYMIAAKAVGLDVSRFGFVAQEVTYPYLGALHWMPADWLTYAKKEVRRIYFQFAAHLESGKFPGYGNGELMPPAYLEEMIEMNA